MHITVDLHEKDKRENVSAVKVASHTSIMPKDKKALDAKT